MLAAQAVAAGVKAQLLPVPGVTAVFRVVAAEAVRLRAGHLTLAWAATAQTVMSEW
jgi:hypothetical protein